MKKMIVKKYKLILLIFFKFCLLLLVIPLVYNIYLDTIISYKEYIYTIYYDELRLDWSLEKITPKEIIFENGQILKRNDKICNIWCKEVIDIMKKGNIEIINDNNRIIFRKFNK